MGLYIIEIPAYPGYGVQIAIRKTLEEAIALREDLRSVGYREISIEELTENNQLIYHHPEIKYGDPLNLYRLLDE